MAGPIAPAKKPYHSPHTRRRKPFSSWFSENEPQQDNRETNLQAPAPISLPMTSLEDMLLLAELPRDAHRKGRRDPYGSSENLDEKNIERNPYQYTFGFISETPSKQAYNYPLR